MEPAAYEAWYQTPRGEWIARREFALLMALLKPLPSSTLLDVGTGTGHFARRFAEADVRVIGLDPDSAMLDHARSLGGGVDYIQGDALALPYPNGSFDYCTAITSLCFVADPKQAVAEMWRVSRRGIALGLLNRRSLLYRAKAGRGGYVGARWDDPGAVRRWVQDLPDLHRLKIRTALFVPDESHAAKLVEHLLPSTLPWGGFLVVHLTKIGD
jgi:SAM-dependent methyltransferase